MRIHDWTVRYFEPKNEMTRTKKKKNTILFPRKKPRKAIGTNQWRKDEIESPLVDKTGTEGKLTAAIRGKRD